MTGWHYGREHPFREWIHPRFVDREIATREGCQTEGAAERTLLYGLSYNSPEV
jgi:hypothetical protein